MTSPWSDAAFERDGWFDPDRPEHLALFGTRLLGVARRLALGVSALGAIVLGGYLVRSAAVVKLWHSLPPMYPNAAVGFLVGGLGILAALGANPVVRRVGAALSGAVGLVAAVTLVLHAADVGSTWLEALWPQDPFVDATTLVAGRPVAETCVAFVALGLSGVLLAVRRAPRLAQGLALGAVSVGLAATFGFVLGVDRRALGMSAIGVGMALHTALGITALGAAAFLSRPRVGLVGHLASAGPGGQLGRRLVAVAVVAPLLLAMLGVVLRAVMADDLLVGSILAVVQAGALAVLVMIPAAGIDRLDTFAREAQRELRRRRESIHEQDAVIAAIASQLLAEPPSPEGWLVAVAQEQASGELAGDTLQLIEDGAGRFLIALFDLAGHGSVAALSAYRFRSEIEALWRHGVPLDEVLAQLNHTALDLDTIATGVLMEVERSTGEIRWLNAGHPPPVQIRHGEVHGWERTGPLLGVSQPLHSVRSHQLGHGDLFVLYTDGMSDARPVQGAPLGDEQLIDLVRAWAHEHPTQIANACLDAARQHAAGRLPDDTLILVLQRR